ncbi:MAG TPA: FAD:protein FMN transferase [Candidatus Binatus sp.]|nr:FAD:protein FMN transferase [Candidatus Binatus sp.]
MTAPMAGAPDLPKVKRRDGRAMASPLRLQVAGEPPEPLVDAAWAEVVDEFEATEQALSRFRSTSEIHRVRLAGGHAQEPSRRLVAALVAADRARRMTRGRFDPRVLPDLERLGSTAAEVPVEIASSTRPDSGRRLLRRAARRGPLEVPVPVDFGGIGKGLALRWAARRAARVLAGRPFLLEAGGDIVGSGAPGADGWRIGIEDPGAGPEDTAPGPGESGPIVVVELPRDVGAVATSSIRRARWLAPDGRLVHHLIDPLTGEPGGDGLLAVTVAGRDPAWAEVWSKSLFLERRDGIASVARARGLAAWWVTAGGAVEMTPAARLRTIWVRGEA